MRHPDESAGVPASGRVARRHKLFEPVAMVVNGKAARAHVLNISATGALLHSSTPPVLGASVHFTVVGTEHAARVVWREKQRFGIAFGNRITEAILQAVLRSR